MPHDIFVSYSRRNLVAVKSLKDGLERLGFSCWMDLQGIESGTWEFSDHIIAAIDASTAVLFFLSNDSQTSAWALKEIGYARDEKKHVVLVRFNDDPLTKKFRFEFGRSDIIDWRIPEQKEKLLRDLREWTGKSQSGGPSSQVSGQGASSSRTGGLVECPVCGKKNRPEETFHCRECGRDNLCLRHQDEETFLCRDCVAKTKKKTSRDAAPEHAGSRPEREGLRRIPENLVKMAKKKAESILSQIKCRKVRNVKGYFEVKISMVAESETTAVAEFVQKLSGTDLSTARNLVEKHRVIAQGLTEEEAENVKSVLQILGADAIVRKQSGTSRGRIGPKAWEGVVRKANAGAALVLSRISRRKSQKKKGGFDVKISAVPDSGKTAAMAIVKKLTGSGLQEVKTLLEKRGTVVQDLTEQEAEVVKSVLKLAGVDAVVCKQAEKSSVAPKSKSFDGKSGDQNSSEDLEKQFCEGLGRGLEEISRACQTPEGRRYFENLDEWAKGMAKKRNAYFFSTLAKPATKPNGRYSETVDGLTWNYEVKDGEASVGIHDPLEDGDRPATTPKAVGSIVIPNRLGGCPVTSIAPAAFSLFTGLASVTIPDGVQTIGNGAFANCHSLSTMAMPDSVTTVESMAFYRCDGLKTIKISSGVSSIEDNAFANCTALVSVTIPEGVRRIGTWAFIGCSALASVAIPPSVTRIEDMAFKNCIRLSAVTIPDGVVRIGASAFAGCVNLASVALPDSLKQMGNGAFFGCSKLGFLTKLRLKSRWPDCM